MTRTGKDRHKKGKAKEFPFSGVNQIDLHAAGMDIGSDKAQLPSLEQARIPGEMLETDGAWMDEQT